MIGCVAVFESRVALDMRLCMRILLVTGVPVQTHVCEMRNVQMCVVYVYIYIYLCIYM